MKITSTKEKCLWIATIAVLAGIYATIGIAQPISNILQNNGLLTPLFFLGMLLVGITILIFGINKNPDKSFIGVSLGIAAVYLMVFIRIEIPQERTHIIEYGVVATLIFQALLERKKQGKKVSFPATYTILITGMAGTIDELLQGIIPNRVFDMRDILFNFLAGAMAVTAISILNWASKRTKKRKNKK